MLAADSTVLRFTASGSLSRALMDHWEKSRKMQSRRKRERERGGKWGERERERHKITFNY